jgi:hypothetical protein
MAETNAYFEELYCDDAEVSKIDDGITITVTGQSIDSNDPERPFSVDQIDLIITVEMDRVAGRNAFGE